MSGFGRAGWFSRSEGDGGGGFEGDVVTIVVVVVVVVECVFNVNALYCVLIELVAFDADGRILVIVAIRLADDSGRSSKNVVGSPAVVIDDGTGHRRIGRQPEASVGNGRWFQTVNRFAARWRTVPSAVDVADEVSAADELVTVFTAVGNDAEILARAVDEFVAATGNPSWPPAFNILADGRIAVEESRRLTRSD